VLGQALGIGVAGSIVAAAAVGKDHGPGVALAFSFGIVVALTAVIVGARLPVQLTGSTADQAR
jgi:Na+-driven multidrug efflux pump